MLPLIHPRSPRHPGALLVGLALGALGCADDGVAGVGRSLPLTLTPALVTLGAGDSAIVRATSTARYSAATRLRWRSGQPALVRVDTAVGVGESVVVRAIAPGDGHVAIEVDSPGYDAAVLTLPVRVTPAR